MGTYAISGAAAGIGAATAALLRAEGHQVVGIDLHDTEVVADLATSQGRAHAVAAVGAACGGRLDGVALFAGVGGATGRPGSLLVALNYFGSVRLFEGLRPLLGPGGSAVAVSSVATTIQPGWSQALVDACLSEDEAKACEVALLGDSAETYPATKVALARWVRRQAPSAAWAGAGVRLNAVAPGLIETAFVEETRQDPVLGSLIDAFPLPLGRGGRAEEVAEVVSFLLSPRSSLLVGTFLLCDGGTEAMLRPDAWPSRWEV
ncbi:MAG: SDR family oxidoreductase [Mycobacteriales bacterium]